MSIRSMLQLTTEAATTMSRARLRTTPLLSHTLSAGRVRAHLAKGAVPLIRLAGPPGAGKTALLEATLKRLAGKYRVGVVVCNPAADRDVEQLRKWCSHVAAINHPIAVPADFGRVIEKIDPDRVDLIFLEGCGGITPFPDVGETATVTVLGVSCGDDKAAEYASLVSRSNAVVLTKTDLLPFIKFSGRVFHDDVKRSNPSATVLEVSVINGHGMDEWLAWMEEQILAARTNHRGNGACGSELFVG